MLHVEKPPGWHLVARRELREGAKREIMERQQGRLQVATLHEHTKHKAQRVRMASVKQQLRSKSDFLRSVSAPPGPLKLWHLIACLVQCRSFDVSCICCSGKQHNALSVP